MIEVWRLWIYVASETSPCYNNPKGGEKLWFDSTVTKTVRLQHSTFMIEYIFRNRKCNKEKLRSFGFIPNGDQFVYTADLAEGQMLLTVKVTATGQVAAQMIDSATGEEYILHRVPGTAGAFVGRIKAEYEAILQRISAVCLMQPFTPW